MEQVYEIKTLLVIYTGLAKDALHVYVALAVFAGSCLAFGWRAYQWKPLLLVAAIAVAGEVVDFNISAVQEREALLGYAIHDLWNTILLPAILFVLARYSAVFRRAEPAPRVDDPELSGD